MYLLAYVTCPESMDLKALAKDLLCNNAAACVNVLPAGISYFEWQGEWQEESERIVLAKTTTLRWDDFVAIVKAHHEYECPCIVALPLTQGYAPFLEWISCRTGLIHD